MQYCTERLCMGKFKCKYEITIILESKGFETRAPEKANHALVLMRRSLADSLYQPIAVFTSRGPVKGIDLAKIIVKSILLLENVSLRIEGITSESATTNRAMWSIIGVSGKIVNMKNYFDNPYDENRKVFVFSDAPHLLKMVTNRLFTKKLYRSTPPSFQ